MPRRRDRNTRLIDIHDKHPRDWTDDDIRFYYKDKQYYNMFDFIYHSERTFGNIMKLTGMTRAQLTNAVFAGAKPIFQEHKTQNIKISS